MSQSFDLTGPSVTSHINFNGADCEKVMLNGTRIWERYIAQQQVWVSSGYNSSSWVYQGELYYKRSPYYRVYPRAGRHLWITPSGYFWRSTSLNWAGFTAGNKKYEKGSWRASGGKYAIKHWTNVTTWVDTSGYETQNVTAYYY